MPWVCRVSLGWGLCRMRGREPTSATVAASNATSSHLIVLDIKSAIGLQLTERLSVGGTLGLGTSYYDGLFVGLGAMVPDYALRGNLGATYDLGSHTTFGAYYQTKQNFTFDDAIRLEIAPGVFDPIVRDIAMDLPTNIVFGLANDRLMDGRLLLALDVIYKNYDNADLFQAVYDGPMGVPGRQPVQPQQASISLGVCIRPKIHCNLRLGSRPEGITVGQDAIQYVQSQLAAVNPHRLSGGNRCGRLPARGRTWDLLAGGMFEGSQRFGATGPPPSKAIGSASVLPGDSVEVRIAVSTFQTLGWPPIATIKVDRLWGLRFLAAIIMTRRFNGNALRTPATTVCVGGLLAIVALDLFGAPPTPTPNPVRVDGNAEYVSAQSARQELETENFESMLMPDCPPAPSSPESQGTAPWSFAAATVGYDSGFVIAAQDDQRLHHSGSPFRMKINGWGQLRHTILDSEGPNRDLNQFNLKRGRLVFSGNAFSPDFATISNRRSQLDGDDIRLLDYYLNFDVGHRYWGLEKGVSESGPGATRCRSPWPATCLGANWNSAIAHFQASTLTSIVAWGGGCTVRRLAVCRYIGKWPSSTAW